MASSVEGNRRCHWCCISAEVAPESKPKEKPSLAKASGENTAPAAHQTSVYAFRQSQTTITGPESHTDSPMSPPLRIQILGPSDIPKLPLTVNVTPSAASNATSSSAINPSPVSVPQPTGRTAGLNQTIIEKISKISCAIQLTSNDIMKTGDFTYVKEESEHFVRGVLFNYLINGLNQSHLQQNGHFVLIANKAFNILAASSAAFKMMDYEPEEMLGQVVSSFLSPHEEISKLNSYNNDDKMETHILCKGGQPIGSETARTTRTARSTLTVTTGHSARTPRVAPLAANSFVFPFSHYYVVLTRNEDSRIDTIFESVLIKYRAVLGSPPAVSFEGLKQDAISSVKVSYLNSENSEGIKGGFSKVVTEYSGSGFHVPEMAFVICRKNFLIVGMSGNAEKMLGYEPRELLSRSFSILTTAESQKFLEAEKDKSTRMSNQIPIFPKNSGSGSSKEIFAASVYVFTPETTDYLVLSMKKASQQISKVLTMPLRPPMENLNSDQVGCLKISYLSDEGRSALTGNAFRKALTILRDDSWHIPGTSFLLCQFDFTIVAMNEESEKLYGYNPHKLMGRNVSMLTTAAGMEKLENERSKQADRPSEKTVKVTIIKSGATNNEADDKLKFDADISFYFPDKQLITYMVLVVKRAAPAASVSSAATAATK